MPKPARIAGVLTLGAVALGLLTGAAPAAPVTSAAATGSLTVFLDCVSQDAATGADTAWFGYSNTTGSAIDIPVGPANQVVGGPNGLDEGQPVHFGTGAFPRVFGVSYAPAANALVVWQVNGELAQANSSAPTCSPGVATPASAVTATTATLNGVVYPGGDDTSYQFTIGTPGAAPLAAPLRVATATSAGSGTAGVPVHADLTGLTPSATYHFQLQATNSLGTFTSQELSFTTAAAPLAVRTTSLPAGRAGRTYSATLKAAGGTAPYLWVLIRGHLPAGLHLARATGVISGTLKSTASSSTFTVTVIDSGTPSRQAKFAAFTITVR